MTTSKRALTLAPSTTAALNSCCSCEFRSVSQAHRYLDHTATETEIVVAIF